MGAALYVVLERAAPDLEGLINGKALSRFEQELRYAAARLEVDPLMGFFSMSAADARFAAEELAAIGEEVPESAQERWFDPDAGLRTVAALLAWVDTEPPTALPGARKDLLDFQRVLREAKQRGLRWHVAVDF